MKKTIKGYSLIGKIATGGMGEVYRAVHDDLEKEVILKKLAPGAPKNFYDRFKREANIMMDISHPNIVHMYDYFQDGKTSYIAMEYIPGFNLGEIIKQYKKLPYYLACYIVYEVSKGLQYAHEQGIIHRDIKPGNVLISSKGEVKLTDFGIAFRSDRETTDDNMTKTGSVLGTPAYMSPEQIQSSRDVDNRTDIYALGILFYEMLTGKRPYQNEFTVDNIRLIKKGKHKPIRKYNYNVSNKVLRMIRKMMKPSKLKRYSTIDEFKIMLEKILIRKYIKISKIKETFTELLKTNNEKLMLSFQYSSFYLAFSFFKKLFITFAILFVCLYLTLKIKPDLIFTYFFGDLYGITDVTLKSQQNNKNSSITFQPYQRQDSKVIDFKISKSKKNVKNIILKSDKYRVILTVDNYIYTDEVTIEPFNINRKNVINFNIVEPLSQQIDFYSEFFDSSGQRLFDYQVYYKIDSEWILYNVENVLKNGKIYSFIVRKSGYEDAIFNDIKISRWQNTFILKGELVRKKAKIIFEPSPVQLNVSIDQNNILPIDKNGMIYERVLINNDNKNYYLDLGDYTFQFSNEKQNINFEKQISIKSMNGIMSFYFDDKNKLNAVYKNM